MESGPDSTDLLLCEMRHKLNRPKFALIRIGVWILRVVAVFYFFLGLWFFLDTTKLEGIAWLIELLSVAFTVFWILVSGEVLRLLVGLHDTLSKRSFINAD